MEGFASNHTGAITRSVLLHAAIFGALIAGAELRPARTMRAPDTAIQTVMLDQDIVDQEIARLAEREPEPVPDAADTEAREAEAARVRAEEQAQRDRELEAQRAEQVRQEEAERARQAQIVLERERAEQAAREEAERRERERQAQLERQREVEEAERREQERIAEERRQREDAQRRRREAEEARQQAELERELQAALAAEEEVRRAVSSGELDRYLRQIQTRIEQAWVPPASAAPGLECVVNVTQIPSGQVTGVTVGECNGDAAVRRSIEAAVLRASPLPTPSVPALFDRNLKLIFKPQL